MVLVDALNLFCSFWCFSPKQVPGGPIVYPPKAKTPSSIVYKGGNSKANKPSRMSPRISAVEIEVCGAAHIYKTSNRANTMCPTESVLLWQSQNPTCLAIFILFIKKLKSPIHF